MKGKKHTPEQIIAKLREAEAELNGGAPVAAVCQKLAISEQTFHRWRNKYGGMKADGARACNALLGDAGRDGVAAVIPSVINPQKCKSPDLLTDRSGDVSVNHISGLLHYFNSRQHPSVDQFFPLFLLCERHLFALLVAVAVVLVTAGTAIAVTVSGRVEYSPMLSSVDLRLSFNLFFREADRE